MKDLEVADVNRPSRSQLKREDQVLHMMAKELVELSVASLVALKLSDQLREAVKMASAMPANKGARKRQLKYIAGILRTIETDIIRERLDLFKNKSAHSARELHKVEHWRARLLSDDKTALTELLDTHPEADIQYLRQLVRGAKKEMALAKPAKSARLLFRQLKGLFDETDQLS
ncbi:MAG TPA: DUF615 domain-containing protein [Methylococcaceae bacterium]|jgi:ribosome-associated protein|nr:DUF615 domain-containing protein [Methylococcaceae bacterium]HIN67827.1 DUF615 domain-containing protein [Methylococcales bacterium]HIA45515.1 DUF615 domain-containing protein [Methylococcaceae bacterium]HIB62900.1 DUF615 domain-containing protein [Methylococcaceae bacterium]HIO12088.1 DUF615 domain-containing protein [Methylococcales bacterium]